MPELPEVETTRRGVEPFLLDQTIQEVVIRQPRLRWEIPGEVCGILPGARIDAVARRAKYLLLRTARGTLIVHLGMSGSLRILPADTPPGRHDHFDLVLPERLMRLHDPRRFGAVLWTTESPYEHPLLRGLGPEPFDAAFHAHYLHQQAQLRRSPVKGVVMDGRVVVGVGNIYANEALFLAGISPVRAANRISLARYARLAEAIRAVLAAAIEQGGTTLRDFQQQDGRPGYFAQQLRVYGREGEGCDRCGGTIRRVVIGQRSTYYCAGCQR